jgi:hypothetical protein
MPEITADKQGSITVSANAVAPIGTTTVVPYVIEFTCMLYTPAVEGSANGPALKTPCAEIVKKLDSLAALVELVIVIDQRIVA